MKWKKTLFEIIKITVTILLLYLLFRKLNFKELKSIFLHIRIPFFILGVFMYLLGIFISSLRWNLFLKHLGFEYKTLNLFSYYLKSLFFANFLPSGGLDVARLMFLGKDKIKEKLSSTFMDRIFGFLAINIYVFLGLLYSLRDTRKYAILIIIFLLLQIIFFFLLFCKKTGFLFTYLKRLPMGEHLYNIYEILHSFREKSIIIKAILYSFLIQLSYSIDVYFIVLSVGKDIGIIRSVLFVPFINFIIMIPVTISGFGMREGGFVFLFKNYIGKEAAIASSLLYYFSVFTVSIIGGISLLRFKSK